MTTARLGIVVGVLLIAIGLAATNPTMDDYVRFVEGKMTEALDRMDRGTPDREKNVIRLLFKAHGPRLIESVVRPGTTRSNWGLCSIYRTNVLDQQVVVLAVATYFVPLQGLDEATVKIGRLAF